MFQYEKKKSPKNNVTKVFGMFKISKKKTANNMNNDSCAYKQRRGNYYLLSSIYLHAT